jgi:hypothetical protein
MRYRSMPSEEGDTRSQWLGHPTMRANVIAALAVCTLLAMGAAQGLSASLTQSTADANRAWAMERLGITRDMLSERVTVYAGADPSVGRETTVSRALDELVAMYGNIDMRQIQVNAAGDVEQPFPMASYVHTSIQVSPYLPDGITPRACPQVTPYEALTPADRQVLDAVADAEDQATQDAVASRATPVWGRLDSSLPPLAIRESLAHVFVPVPTASGVQYQEVGRNNLDDVQSLAYWGHIHSWCIGGVSPNGRIVLPLTHEVLVDFGHVNAEMR